MKKICRHGRTNTNKISMSCSQKSAFLSEKVFLQIAIYEEVETMNKMEKKNDKRRKKQEEAEEQK